MDVLRHACDCARVDPEDVRFHGVAVTSTSRHVRRKLALARQALGLRAEVAGEVAVIRDVTDLALLREHAATWKPTERSLVLAAPLDAGGSWDAFRAVPLELAVLRASTPWIADALTRRALVPHLQPIVRLADGSVAGYEALIRVDADVVGRTIYPDELIAAAVAHDALFAFDQHARASAIEKGFPLVGPDAYLSVNFIPTAIYDPAVCLATTWSIVRRLGITPDRLVFEIVETERFPDLGYLQEILAAYRAHGCRVALDDLGAGHTSLVYLRELRPDIVKVDRALVSNLTADDARLELVAGVTAYAHALGATVVCEGVETLDDLVLLRDLGVDCAQGYALARPAPVAPPVAPGALDVLRRRAA
jgi:EAL domain-containing protein (putative c-di-GMP-specific phosphodiesterase class I)